MTARWQFWAEDSSPYSEPRLACYDGKTSDIKLSDVTDEQGAVLAEALNAHEATGLTPAQLQARVAELEGALADEREKAAFWAAKAHELRGQALRGEPIDGIVQPCRCCP